MADNENKKKNEEAQKKSKDAMKLTLDDLKRVKGGAIANRGFDPDTSDPSA